MTATYKLDPSELSTKLINCIKEAVKGKTLEITVTDAVDETDYLLSKESNKYFLLDSLEELQSVNGVVFTLEGLHDKYGQ